MLMRLTSAVFFVLSGLCFFGLVDITKGGYGFAALGVAALVLIPVVDGISARVHPHP